VIFGNSPFGDAAAVVFLTLLLLASISDVRERRVPNRLNAALALSGLCYTIAAHPVFSGIGIALGGLAIGLVIWFPSYAFGLLGAGDVKLAAAGGMWLGPMRTFEAAIIGGLFGGLLALVWLLRFRGIRGTATTLWLARVLPRTLVEADVESSTREHLPYGVALALGLAIAAWLPKHIL
jgi:prepilin peptidase CpaA